MNANGDGDAAETTLQEAAPAWSSNREGKTRLGTPSQTLKQERGHQKKFIAPLPRMDCDYDGDTKRVPR